MKLGEFFQRLILGKPKNDDFRAQDLPKNRRQVLKYILKNSWLKFLKVSLLTAVFFFPLLMWQIYSGITILQTASAEFAKSDLLGVVAFNMMVNVPLIMLASIGLAGGIYVARQMAWDEPVSVWRDFKKGIGYGIKQYLIYSFLLGVLLYFIMYYAYALILGGEANTLKFTALMLIVLLAVALSIITMYVCCLSSLYNMKFFDVLKAAFIYTFKKLPKNLLIFLISVIPCSVMIYIPVGIVQYIGVFFISCFGFAYVECVWVLYTNSVFDKYINAVNYPDFVRKGLYRGEDTEIEGILSEQFEELYGGEELEE